VDRQLFEWILLSQTNVKDKANDCPAERAGAERCSHEAGHLDGSRVCVDRLMKPSVGSTLIGQLQLNKKIL